MLFLYETHGRRQYYIEGSERAHPSSESTFLKELLIQLKFTNLNFGS